MNNAVSHQLQVPLSKLPTVAVNGADPISAAGLGNSSLIDVQLDDIARLEGILRDVDDLS